MDVNKPFTQVVTTADQLRDAVTNAAEGAVIGIEKGEYDLSGHNMIVFKNKRNVMIRSVTGCPDDVVFKGSGFHKKDGHPTRPIDEPILILANCHHITIHGITFRDSNCHGVKVSGEGNNSYVTVDRCKFFDINERMIKGSMGHDGAVIPGMRVTNNYFEDTQLPYESDHMDVFEGNYISAMDMMVLHDAVVSNNVFVNIKGKSGGGRGAVFIWGLSKNITVENNVFIQCDRGIAFGNPGSISVAEGNAGYFVDGGVIRNNTIIGSTGQGIEIANTNNVTISNNTIYCPTNTTMAIEDTGSKKPDRVSANLTICDNVIKGVVDAPLAVTARNVFVE